MNFLDGCIMQSSLFCLEDRRAANHDFVIVTGTEHARWLHNGTGPFRTQVLTIHVPFHLQFSILNQKEFNEFENGQIF